MQSQHLRFGLPGLLPSSFTLSDVRISFAPCGIQLCFIFATALRVFMAYSWLFSCLVSKNVRSRVLFWVGNSLFGLLLHHQRNPGSAFSVLHRRLSHSLPQLFYSCVEAFSFKFRFSLGLVTTVVVLVLVVARASSALRTLPALACPRVEASSNKIRFNLGTVSARAWSRWSTSAPRGFVASGSRLSKLASSCLVVAWSLPQCGRFLCFCLCLCLFLCLFLCP